MLFFGSQIALIALLVGFGAMVSSNKKRGLLVTLIICLLSQVSLILGATILKPDFQILRVNSQNSSIAKFSLLFLLCFAVLVTGFWFCFGKVRFKKSAYYFTWKTLIFSLFRMLLGGFLGLAFFATLWVYRNFGTQTVGTIRFFLTGNPLGDTTPDQYVSIVSQVFVPTFLFAILVMVSGILPWQTIIHRGEQKHVITVKVTRRFFQALMAMVMALQVFYIGQVMPVIDTVRSFIEVSTFVDQNFVEANDKNLVFPKKPKNLIHIVMESMENSYYSKTEGGYLERSLMPDMAQLTKENVSFSESDKFGGPYQINGATNSIAGIFNMQTGMFMAPVALSNNWNIPYADLPNLGAILHKHGYENLYMLGGQKEFHQLGDYFTNYGKFNVLDLNTYRERGYVPKDYFVFWGVEDDKLYEYAKTELTRLGTGKNPFYLLLENADTHNNGGYVSPRMTETPSDKQYGNVIHYSQAETVKLVRWIQQQPWYKDTVILITGDHLSKDNTFFIGWDKSYNRSIINIIINGVPPKPGAKITQNREYNPFDFFPTTVRALGITIKGNRLGLGTDLYSGQPTLLEKYGRKKINEESNKRSQYYEKRLIKDLVYKEIKETR